MHRSSCRVITGCLSSTSILLLHPKALLPPLRVTLTHHSLSYFEHALNTTSIFSFSLSRPKGSWKFFSSFYNLTPNLQLFRKPLILCLPKSPWSTPSYSISYQLYFPCSRNDSPSISNAAAVSYLSTLLIVTSLSGLMARFQEGWEGGFTFNVLNVSLLPLSPFRVDAGPLAIVPRLMPYFALLSGAFLTSHHVSLNPSPYSPTFNLF